MNVGNTVVRGRKGVDHILLRVRQSGRLADDRREHRLVLLFKASQRVRFKSLKKFIGIGQVWIHQSSGLNTGLVVAKGDGPVPMVAVRRGNDAGVVGALILAAIGKVAARVLARTARRELSTSAAWLLHSGHFTNVAWVVREVVGTRLELVSRTRVALAIAAVAVVVAIAPTDAGLVVLLD